MFSISDQTLVNRALDGSERSWVKLVKRHEPRLYNYCLRMTGSESDALDLLQEIFLSVFRHLPSWKGTGDFSHWLMRIAAHKAIDLHRQKQRVPVDLQDDDRVFESVTAPEGYSPASHHEANERNRLVLLAMASLTPEQRLVIELKFFQQMTFEEISSCTGVPVNTVKSRFYTTLTTLKDNPEARHAL